MGFNNEAINLLKERLVKLAVEKIMQELVLSAAFFKIPFFNYIATKLVTKLVEFIVEKTELGLYFVYVDFTVAKEADQLREALEKYNREKSEQNEKELTDKFKDFIRIKP